MAEKRRYLDVWLVEPNTVYREVPYLVVADWVQQARMVPDDMLRPSGTAEWFRVGDSPEFSPYLPKAEAVFVDDEASAREDVSLGFRWRKRKGDEDDDVDMIPLIDVSLVLLVFFMLTSTIAEAGGLVSDVPGTKSGMVIGKEGMIYINVKPTKRNDQDADFSLSIGPGGPIGYPDEKSKEYPRTVGEVIEQMRGILAENKDLGDVTIRADEKVESGIIRDLTVEMTKIIGGNRIKKKFYGVREEEEQK